jgi:PPOX class probable F420-dependent enzyme
MSDDSSTPPDGSPKRSKPSVRLSPDEAWEMIEGSHTGILTTLRRDGVPIALPIWFGVIDRTILLTTPGRSKKTLRIRHDSRASFLVEAGEMWAELKAVHLTGRAEVVDDPDLAARLGELIDEKYAAFRTKSSAMPEETRKHYASASALIRFVPDERIVSWDNARLGIS